MAEAALGLRGAHAYTSTPSMYRVRDVHGRVYTGTGVNRGYVQGVYTCLRHVLPLLPFPCRKNRPFTATVSIAVSITVSITVQSKRCRHRLHQFYRFYGSKRPEQTKTGTEKRCGNVLPRCYMFYVFYVTPVLSLSAPFYIFYFRK